MFNNTLISKAEQIIKLGSERHWRISTGESCTGGLVAALLTEIPGSSIVVGRCFVTYSNRAKREILNVPADLLKTHGAVSAETVKAMAQNLFNQTTAHLTLAISGVAGPGGGSPDKPVGTVHMATATEAGLIHQHCQFGDIGRSAVRMATVDAAADMLLARLSE
jgi:nicotinamide-nucleotide amidase